MPSWGTINTLQGFGNALQGGGAIQRFGQDYLAGQEADTQRRQQEFEAAAINAGHPLASMPYAARGLFPSLLQGIGILPREIQATPAELGMQKAALQDRELQKILAVSQLAGRISPQGLAALAKMPGFQDVLGGIPPEVMAEFQTPMDYKQLMVQQQLEAKVQHDKDMLAEKQFQDQQRAQSAELSREIQLARLDELRNSTDLRRQQFLLTMDEKRRADEEKQTIAFRNMLDKKINLLKMTNPAQAQQLMQLGMEFEGALENMSFQNAKTSVIRRHPELFGGAAAAPPGPSGPGFFTGLGRGLVGALGGGGPTPPAAGAPPAAGGSGLPPLPW